MKKPVGNYEELEQKLRENSERKARFSGRKMALGFVTGGVIAATLGLGGMPKSEGHNTQETVENPKEIKMTPQVTLSDSRTATFDVAITPAEDTPVNTPEETYQQLDDIYYEQLGKGIGAEKKVPEGTKLGERQGVLKENEIPQYHFTGASPQLDPQDYDDGVEHGGKGIQTWQNSDDLSQVKDYRKADMQNSSKQAQVDLAMQMIKGSKNNHMG